MSVEDTVRLTRFFALVALCLLITSRTANAQTTGSISGHVADTAGGPLPGVAVEATSPNLQGLRTAVTDSAGTFRFPEVAPGAYRVRAALVGFRAVEKTATVSLGATTTVDLLLQIAAEAQVAVSGEAPLIDQASTTTGTNYTSNVIAHLPVARNYADIVKANPGVSTDRGDTEGRSLALTIYGATSAENQWIIDGVNTTNAFKGVQGKAINNEFVQEVEVKTGGYQAEYGRALGGLVNVITKSGGNEFHGDGFVYYDSTGTAAEQQFHPGDSGLDGMRVVDGERFDYGADLGGFLVKDRLWFFGAYNRVTRQDQRSRFQASQDVSKSDLFPFEETGNLYSGKLTWNVASTTSIVGTVFADPSASAGLAGDPPVSLVPPTWYSARTQGGTHYGLRASQLLGSKAMLVLQGSYHRDRNELTAPPGVRSTNNTCVGGTPDRPCDQPPEPVTVTGGYGFISAIYDHNTSSRKQLAGGATYYEGNHELKAGADYLDGRTDGLGGATGGQLVTILNEYGQTYYVHDFFAVSEGDHTFTDIRRRAQVLDYGVYVQDSWRAAPGLTVDLGLRWDGEQTRIYTGQTVLRFSNNWQPRVGVVWDPWRNGATKVYAFAGRFSYALPTAVAAMAFNSITSVTVVNFDPFGVTPDPILPGTNTQSTGPFGDSVDAGLKASSMDELTLGVERLIGPALTVGVKGTYRSLKNTVEDRCDFNSNIEGINSCALINPGSEARFASGDAPACDGFNALTDPVCAENGPASPAAKRIYRGIELFARQSLGDRLWLQASYVHSSLRGNYDGGVNEASGGTTPGWNSDFDFPAMWHNAYGILALDRPNSFRFDGYWLTPWRVSVGLQAFAESGAPLNKMGFFNWDYGSSIFLVPRGSAGRLPTLWGANLTLGYPIAIGPATVTLQATLFNIFNKQIAISRDEVWTNSPPDDYPDSAFDPSQQPSDPSYYGSVNHRSEPRVFRAAVKISF